MKKILIIICTVFIFTASVVTAEEVYTGAELSPIERSYTRLQITSNDVLRQFGYDLINTTIPTHSSLVGKDYVLGPNDSLRIYLWGDSVDLGALQSLYEVDIDLDGGLFFPPAGRISVYGRTIKDVERTLTERLNIKYNAISVEVAPSRIRTFPVYVSGYVSRPGSYEVNGLWTVLDVLGQAGGVQKEGSLRNIQIWRDGSTIPIDLYDLFILGKPVDELVHEGDVIFIPSIGDKVAIDGEVKRPGVYELLQDSSFSTVLQFAGGVQVTGAAYTIRIIQQAGYSLTLDEVVSDFNQISRKNLSDGDYINISPSNAFSSNIVEVKGSVVSPGLYTLEEMKMLSDLLRAAKLRYDADTEFSILVRDDVFSDNNGIVFSPREVLEGLVDYELKPNDSVNIYKVERTYQNSPLTITGLVNDQKVIPYTEGVNLLDVLREVELVDDYKGLKVRIVRDGEIFKEVALREMLLKGNLEGNVSLAPADMLVFLEVEETENTSGVKVLGQVNDPGVYPFGSDPLRLSDVLQEAGGFTSSAYPQALYLIRESVKEIQIEQIRKTIALTEQELNSLEASIAVKDNLSSAEKSIVSAQIASQRSLLESAAESQGDMLGRIALTIPASIQELRGSSDDIVLHEGDYIFVPEKSEYITVVGDVDSTIALPWKDGKKVKDYLFELGGLRAKDYTISIIKYNGKVVREENLFFGWTTIEGQTLQPGDVVIAIKKIKIPAGTQIIEGLAEVTDSVYKVVYSLNALDFFN